MGMSILCAVDLEHADVSQEILFEGAKLASTHDGFLTVITVVPDYGLTFVGAFFREDTLKRAIDAANEALHSFTAQTLPGTELRHMVSCGNVYEEVLDASEKIKADLIVMGASKPDIKDFLLGPNAARVARHAKCSVYIVRKR